MSICLQYFYYFQLHQNGEYERVLFLSSELLEKIKALFKQDIKCIYAYEIGQNLPGYIEEA